MMDWQPIETAPKDGTRVLLGRFTGDKKAQQEGYVSVDWYRAPDSDAGFVGFGHFNTTYWPATHWMPLPAPPVCNTSSPECDLAKKGSKS